jgi:hypothetical protein
MTEQPQSEKAAEGMEWRTFLAETPPYGKCALEVKNTVSFPNQSNPHRLRVETPPVLRHCELCNASLTFDSSLATHHPSYLAAGQDAFLHVVLTCRNCQQFRRHVFVMLQVHRQRDEVSALKIGELPRFGRPIPPRLLRIAGEHQDLLRQGWRALEAGLGIGAFAYFRQLVERSKDGILDELISVMQREGCEEGDMVRVANAKTQKQFRGAVKSIQDLLPTSLNFQGKNVLVRLHETISADLHAGTDADCLRRAAYVELLLVDLCERVQSILQDRGKLEAAARLVDQLSGERRANAKRARREPLDSQRD